MNSIRDEKNLRTFDERKMVPFFDPEDGGVRSRVMFLLEAPGRKALESEFVSRDNDDQTAQKLCKLLQGACIPREETIIWNIIPWYLGLNGRIRHPKKHEIEEGRNYLIRLLSLLDKLEVIVLVGRQAQRILPFPDKGIKIFESFHPSPNYVNRRQPDNEEQILKSFKEVAEFLGCKADTSPNRDC